MAHSIQIDRVPVQHLASPSSYSSLRYREVSQPDIVAVAVTVIKYIYNTQKSLKSNRMHR